MMFDLDIPTYLKKLTDGLSILIDCKKNIIESIQNKKVYIPNPKDVPVEKLPHYINLIEPGFNYISNIHHVNITKDYYLHDGAFANCINLISVDVTEFHSNQNMIPHSCFYNCQKLSVVKGLTDTSKLDNYSNILSIGDYAFYNCHLCDKNTDSQIHFNKKLKYIGHHAFDSIKKISLHPWYNLQFLDQLEFIGDAAFKNNIHVWCHFQLPKSVKHIGASAFYNCSNLHFNHGYGGGGSTYHNINQLTNLTSLGEYAYYKCSNLVWTLVFPPSLKSIKRYTFAECSSLPGVNLSNIISVYDCAYYNCKKIKNINITPSVKYIGPSAFYNCTELQKQTGLSFNLSNFNNISSIGTDALYNVSPKNLTCYLFDYNNYIVPGNMNFKNTETIQINSNTDSGTLNYIPLNLFKDNIKLKSIILKNNINRIDDNAFNGCSNLISVTSTTLTSIGNNAFCNCSNLTSITFNSSINTIGKEAFYNCNKLKTINLPSDLILIDNSTFNLCKNLLSIEIKANVKSINDNAFSGCEKLKSVTFGSGSSLQYIGKGAFKDCKILSSISLNKKINTIDVSAFANCSTLKTVSFNGTELTAINDFAFCNCSNLLSISIPSSVKYIGKSAFQGCTKLSSVIIKSNSDLEINQRAFYNCNKLASITISATNLKLGTGIFKSDSSYSAINKTLDIRNIYVDDIFEEKFIEENDKYIIYRTYLGKIFNTLNTDLIKIWSFFDLPKAGKSDSYHVIRYKLNNGKTSSKLMGNTFRIADRLVKKEDNL